MSQVTDMFTSAPLGLASLHTSFPLPLPLSNALKPEVPIYSASFFTSLTPHVSVQFLFTTLLNTQSWLDQNLIT